MVRVMVADWWKGGCGFAFAERLVSKRSPPKLFVEIPANRFPIVLLRWKIFSFSPIINELVVKTFFWDVACAFREAGVETFTSKKLFVEIPADRFFIVLKNCGWVRRKKWGRNMPLSCHSVFISAPAVNHSLDYPICMSWRSNRSVVHFVHALFCLFMPMSIMSILLPSL